MRDLYAEVTARIVAALEAGTPPWIRPWSGALEAVPTNGASRRPYRGINCILLTLEAQLRGFGRNNVWLTYRQARELGAQVRGGERGTTVVFYKRHEVPAEAGDEGSEPRVVPLLRSFTVFNVAQIDRLQHDRHARSAVITRVLGETIKGGTWFALGLLTMARIAQSFWGR